MKFFVLCGFICLAIFSCKQQKINQTSSDRLYKKENNELNAKYLIYHINDTVSQLFYDISNEALVYKKSDTSTYFYSDVRLFIRTSLEDNLEIVADTASLSIKDRQTDVKVKQLSGSIFFKLKQGNDYLVDITVYDQNKRVRYSNNLLADKSSLSGRQNFLLTNQRNEIYFTSYFKQDDIVFVQSIRNNEKTYEVDYFNPSFKLALPPFSTAEMPHFSYKPDYTKTIYYQDNKMEVVLPKAGFCHLRTNNETKDGVTFFVYESSFPKIKNAEQMILATRYIMAKKEFDNCMNNPDKKMAIDQYWLDVAGSAERATSLIKKYYGRVQETNRLFSSYQEGWKTDRGMIYIVFGAPNRVTKRKNGEVWTYGETGNPNSIVFSFIKVINPFTNNDYYLERNELFKMPWYQAVDMWRQGRVYLDN